jgi:hypothetical protein
VPGLPVARPPLLATSSIGRGGRIHEAPTQDPVPTLSLSLSICDDDGCSGERGRGAAAVEASPHRRPPSWLRRHASFPARA